MTTQTSTALYAIDATHSTAEFAVKHLMISTVKGTFRQLEGRIHFDERDPGQSSVEATIRTESVDTGNATRDDDLRSPNFFDAGQFPVITFRSSRVERVADGGWRVHGELTIRDVTRPITLDAEFEGQARDPWGGERIGFTAAATLNRKDYGLTYNQVLETGGVVVGDNVKIALHIEGVRQS